MARLVVEPEVTATFADELKRGGFEAIAPTQPQHTRIIPLRAPAEMLAIFKHGRRYNIRAGTRRGVTVIEGKDAAELARQSAAVERRESIRLPERRYYDLLVDLLPWCRTYVASAPGSGEALATVPTVTLGRFFILTGYRKELHGMLEGTSPYPWNLSWAS